MNSVRTICILMTVVLVSAVLFILSGTAVVQPPVIAADSPASYTSSYTSGLIGTVMSKPIGTYAYSSREEMWSDRMPDLLETGSVRILNYARLRIDPKNAGADFTIAQACDLYDFLNREWVLLEDPEGPDYISSATETLHVGMSGDCDDYSVMYSSLCLNLGGKTRVVTVLDSDSALGHAYPELYIGSTQDEALESLDYVKFRYGCDAVWYSVSNVGNEKSYWLNTDWILRKVPVDVSYYTNGTDVTERNIYHPGKEYYMPLEEVTIYYPDGSYVTEPSQVHGYYYRKGGFDQFYEE